MKRTLHPGIDAVKPGHRMVASTCLCKFWEGSSVSGAIHLADHAEDDAVFCELICFAVRCELRAVSVDAQAIYSAVVTLHKLNPVVLRLGESKSGPMDGNQY